MTDLDEIAEIADLTGLSEDERQAGLADGRKARVIAALAEVGIINITPGCTLLDGQRGISIGALRRLSPWHRWVSGQRGEKGTWNEQGCV
jgi:hypothetical protein